MLAVLDLWGSAIVGLAVLACFVAERRAPLRVAVRPLGERLGTNLPMVAIAALILRLAMVPAALGTAALAEQAGIGLLRWLPATGASLIGFLLLDWSIYLWHRLNHRVSWLWRFHLVHHTDLDLDVTTAFRFHAGELLLSVGWRTVAILAIGPSPALLVLYEVVTQSATAFHHSNWRLPARVERALALVLMTPALHGIHHSIVEAETNSNWSVVFSWWDRLHGTGRGEATGERLTIGLPAWRDARELGLIRLLALPFTRQPSAWRPR
ncbi:MAG TPA: sterol desaturase family protein [Methylomirabilota bacterium]|jgi:sterol desaturase/sphingolipid hydroxylase (fatty acid hydroxylase superfamily)|nr:sterol desaturase family protein [Methylomirabilota bacterium]